MRRIHHVGTIPAISTRAAMALAVERTGRHLVTLPDGETGDRQDWIATQLESRAAQPGLITLRRSRMRRPGPMRLWHTPLYAARPGWPVTADSLNLGYATAAARAWPVLNHLKVEHRLPDLRLQVGIPGPFDITLLSWARPLRHYQAEVDAALREIEAIEALTDRTAVYQLELPLESVITARAPSRLRPGIARRLAARAADFVAHAPSGSTWIVHLCVGDPHGAPFVTPTDARPLVELANALFTQWPGGHTLEAMHLPLGDGKHPAPADAAYYAPLADLTLPETVHVSAGLAHADAPLDDQLMALKHAETVANRGPLGVSTPCGLGRRPKAVPDTMERLVALANATV